MINKNSLIPSCKVIRFDCGHGITEQTAVNEMAKAIETAIAALEYKDNPDTDTSSPQTGDDSNIVFWIVILLAAGAALTSTAVYSRKRKHSR